MTDISTIEAALDAVAKGRFSAVKFDKGRISLVLNVGGLDVRERGQQRLTLRGRMSPHRAQRVMHQQLR